jgi:hypothetical protein
MNVLPVQLAWRQPVLVDQGRHAPAPLQVPSFAQFPAAGLVATQRPFGSAPPDATTEQVPTRPATRQLEHRPIVPVVALVQAVLQQTPSVQNALEHWAFAVHAAPFGFRPHEPLPQVFGAMQSASVAHELLHAPVAQMNVPHDAFAGVTHAPVPLHVDAGVTDVVVAHTEALQFRPLA